MGIRRSDPILRTARGVAAVAACLALANCASSDKFASRVDPKYGVSSSPRVVALGEPVPKGGGTYRIGKPYTVGGRIYVPEEDTSYREEGMASWYGDDFHGRLTANGEVFDMGSLTAAHPTLPMPCYARVTNLGNGKSLIVRVNDRGPYHGNRLTGVSGSGKSTLVNEIVFKSLANKLNRTRTKPGTHRSVEGIEVFDKVIDIDQRPIGRTPRSNPATYTDLFTHIRELYSLTPEAKVRGYKPGRFSFNVRGGRCETCKGDGQIKIEMHFLPDVYVACETCKGARYNRETLEVRFKGKTIADVLDMSVEEALRFFAKIPKIRRRLQTLHDVGLDYIKLGQPATTLSGGEAQRVKLASELSKVATGKTLYILDEPTTGLHFADIEKLLETLQRLVDAGNTMIVIEHNLDVIKQADWIVDLGPEGGDAGGEVIAVGTPEDVAAVEDSFTGLFLRGVLPAVEAVAAA